MFECDYTHSLNPWQVYEERKRLILAKNLPPAEYQQAISELLEELGL